jgi:hypothetical protein
MASHSPSHAPDSDDGEASIEMGVDNNNAGFDYRSNNNNNDDSGFSYRIKNHDDIPPLNDTHLGVELGYAPPDQRPGPGMPVELIAQLADPEIEEDTEAAEALRANANVKVRKMGKVARSLNAQSVRRFLKLATLRGKSGNRKGKPPRIPPGRTAVEEPGSNIFVVTEEAEEEVSSQEGDDISEGSVAASVPGMTHDDHQSHGSAGAGAPAISPLGQHAVPDQHNSYTIDMQNPNPIGPVTLSDSVLIKTKHARNANAIDEAKDIPADVVAATMEAGRKCK